MKQLITLVFLVAIFGVGTVSTAPAAEVSPEMVDGATSVDANAAKSLFDEDAGLLPDRIDIHGSKHRSSGSRPARLVLNAVHRQAVQSELLEHFLVEYVEPMFLQEILTFGKAQCIADCNRIR